MQHRDIITLRKIVSEADFVIDMLSSVAQDEFSENEILITLFAADLLHMQSVLKVFSLEVPWQLCS